MTGKKKVDTRTLVSKIEKITRERMNNNPVVSIGEYKKIKSATRDFCVLIIEDDETQRKSLSRAFVDDGYQVISAQDGVQLSQLLDAQPIDLIVLDVGLPWINGFELAELMKEHEDLKQIPLIFISANATPEDVKRGFEVGADDFLKKPFSIDQIRKAVKALLPADQ